MKVICIGDIPKKCRNSSRVVDVPLPGEIDVVIEERVFAAVDFYVLERFGKSVGFEANFFIPLSDIDETELMERRIENVNN